MPEADLLFAFLTATLLFAYMPGPSTLYAAGQTLARGKRAGYLAALGLHLGGYAHVLAATFGLALVFQAIPILYSALKVAGAIYLVWIGLNLILSSQPASTTGEPTPRPVGNALRQSVIVEILNPKTALFYVAFLPQFTDPAASLPLWSQLLLLGTVVNLLFSSADLLFVKLADRVTRAFAQASATRRVLSYLGGGALIGLGLYTALSDPD